MEQDHANTCRPIIRACTGFFDEWEASVNVHVGHSRLDQTLLSQNQTSCRAQDRLKPVHQFVTNSSEQAVNNNRACSIQMHVPAKRITSDVAKLVEALGLGAHLYTDDNQLYGHCSPSNSFELASRFL